MWSTIWNKWLAFGEWIGTIIGKAMLTVFYFTIFLIPALYLSIKKDNVEKEYCDKSYFIEVTSDLSIDTIEEAMEM